MNVFHWSRLVRLSSALKEHEENSDDVAIGRFMTQFVSLQNDKDYEYLNKSVRDGKGRFVDMADIDIFTLVKNS